MKKQLVPSAPPADVEWLREENRALRALVKKLSTAKAQRAPRKKG